MAKPDKPLLSLGARGTIGDALTYQKRGREHIVREKPIPRDPYSLNQAYQRWDYRDYAYQWTLLTNSEKQVYRTKASKYHITGFSQFMREQLKTLPDLAGRWHLDEKSGATAYDSSKNTNNGVIIGASPISGVIDGAFFFDGLNDFVEVPHSPSLDITEAITIEMWINITGAQRVAGILAKSYYTAPGDNGGYEFRFGLPNIQLVVGNDNWGAVTYVGTIDDGAFHHLLAYFYSGAGKIFLDGEEIASAAGLVPTIKSTTQPLYIGRYRAAAWFKGVFDEARVYNRVLDATEIKRHSERRYPA